MPHKRFNEQLTDDVARIDPDALILDVVDPSDNRDSHHVDSRVACHSQCQATGTFASNCYGCCNVVRASGHIP